MECNQVYFSRHAIERMFQRSDIWSDDFRTRSNI